MPFLNLLGTFSTSAMILSLPVVNPLTKSGVVDAFVAKYNSSGTPLWARRLGGTDSDYTLSVSTDSSGNVIAVGYYFSSMNIYAADGTSTFTTLTNSGLADFFIVKYGSDGTPSWARRIGGTGDDYPQSVSTDSSGNIIVSGYYASSTLNIFAADGSTVSLSLSNSGSIDSAIVKYDSSGTPLWARRIGGTGDDTIWSVTTDSSGNVIVVGRYDSLSLNIFAANGSTASFTLTNTNGLNDSFIVKYGSDGTPSWARRIGGASDDVIRSVSTDSSGNVIVGGWYTSSTLNIFAANGSTVSLSLSNSGSIDSAIVKYDSSGTPLWARRLGGSGGDTIWSLCVDSSGNIIVGGYYSSSTLNIFAANGSTVSLSLSNSGSDDGFVVKYDSSGTPLWARRLGGTGNDNVRSVTTDSSGNVIVVGRYASNPLNIFAADGTTASFTLTNSGSDDGFVVKYDSSGTPLWAKKFAGTGGENAESVSTDSSGNIIVGGWYTSTSLSF